MGGKNVKNTMIERVLEIGAPHPCSGCGKVGSIICDNCKFNITHEPLIACILCAKPHKNGKCAHHTNVFERAFVVGSRNGVLEDVINQLKFSNNKAAAKDLADTLHARLPLLPDNTYIVPVPTLSSHVRQRGYDQVLLISRYLASLRQLQVVQVLERTSTSVQHTATKQQRITQAATAYKVKENQHLDPNATYLLLDDIITTGATVTAAADALSKAGAKVWVTGLAYQPLD